MTLRMRYKWKLWKVVHTQMNSLQWLRTGLLLGIKHWTMRKELPSLMELDQIILKKRREATRLTSIVWSSSTPRIKWLTPMVQSRRESSARSTWQSMMPRLLSCSRKTTIKVQVRMKKIWIFLLRTPSMSVSKNRSRTSRSRGLWSTDKDKRETVLCQESFTPSW